METNIYEETLQNICCNLGEQKHVLIDPIKIECGHLACKSCFAGSISKKCLFPNCGQIIKCGKYSTTNPIYGNQNVEAAIEATLYESFQHLKNEFIKCFKQYENKKYIQKLDANCDLIEKQIRQRCEILKSQIDDITNCILDDFYKTRIKFRRLISFNVNKAVSDSDSIFCKKNIDLTRENYKKWDENLKNLKTFLHDISNFDFNIYFRPSEFVPDKNLLGAIEHSSVDELFVIQKLIFPTEPKTSILCSNDAYSLCNINDTLLCVSLYHDGELLLFNKNFEVTKRVSKIGGHTLNNPHSLSYDGREKIVICDALSHNLIVTDTSFKSASIVGRKGTQVNEFQFPYDCAFHDYHLYVCDCGNKRVQKLSIDDFIAVQTFNLKFAPTRIKILNDTAMIKDENGINSFFGLRDFKMKTLIRMEGVMGTIGELFFLFQNECVYFYDTNGQFNSSIKINTVDLHDGDICVFNNTLVVTEKEHKLLLLKDLFYNNEEF